jgi:hypothetical protein
MVNRKAERPLRPVFKEITLERLRNRQVELAKTYNHGDVSQIIANEIAIHFLGEHWYNRYVKHTSRHATYFRVDNTASTEQITTGITRWLEFSETLLNLQHITGFEIVLGELFNGEIEAACAELEIARMLAMFGWKFAFVCPIGGAKQNYDLEVFYQDGYKVCAETAAKLEATAPRAKSILTSIRDSREQLPDEEPGVIFIKVPERWVRDIELANRITNVANGYLNQSEHIRSIKFYSPITIFTPERTARWHLYIEVSNPKFQERNWDMFQDENVPTGGRPQWWIRIF